jgi:Ca2+-binding RTX toxin-like protein
VFNCERVTRLRGAPVPGTLRVGTPGPDDLNEWRWSGRDFIDGLGGDDYLNGHGNADILWGSDGNDRLDGDLNRDMVLGGPGDDTLWGNNGLDRLWGGSGFDIIQGDAGNDEIFSLENDGVVDRIDCGDGTGDRAVVRSNDFVENCERVIRIVR